MTNTSVRPKVIFLTTGYPTNYRPYECIFIHRSIKALSDHINAQVVHFRALKPGRQIIEERKWDGVSVISISCPQLPFGSYSHLNTKLMELFGVPLISKVINSVDLLHSAEIYPAGFVTGKWAKLFRKPFTSNVIGSDLSIFLKRNINKVSEIWLEKLQGVVCNSNALQHELFNVIGWLPNVSTIYRGVDTETFIPKGLKSGPQAALPPLRLLFLGGFHTWNPKKAEFNLKGGHTLLEAWKLVEEKGLSISLTVGGPGVFKEKLDEWKKCLLNPQNFQCINSILPNEIPDYIRAADVVIIPSLNEGLPNLAKEALACGRPVIGSNVGGIPEVIEHKKTGLIISPNVPQELSQAILWFYRNQDHIEKMGISGRERILKDFSWDQYRQRMVAFFRSVI